MSSPVDLAAVILAAGMGTRMKSALPKVMHPLAGRPMIVHLLETVRALSPQRVVAVIGPEMPSVAKAVAPWPCVEQTERLGTGHAVAQARSALDGFSGDVLILYGDTPLIEKKSLEAMRQARRNGAGVVVLGFRPDDPGSYGRLVTDAKGGLEAIVEAKEATEAQRAITLCNSGVMCVDGARLFDWISRVDNKNAKGEYYLTDIVALARADGLACAVVEGAEEEMLGVNSRIDLAQAEAVMQARLRQSAMENGATLIDPATVHFCHDTQLGRDVTIDPYVVFGPGVVVEDGVHIKGFSHIEGALVRARAQVGPYTRLRPQADIGEDCHIGNFVEIKKATVETGAKVNHLTYIGDARIGTKTNIGAGTITCNYDGFFKYHTDIGANVFIGSNTALVAPVSIGDGATVGAGSVITRSVDPGALSVARGKQADRAGWGERFREVMRERKAKALAAAEKAEG